MGYPGQDSYKYLYAVMLLNHFLSLIPGLHLLLCFLSWITVTMVTTMHIAEKKFTLC